jgi:hypothetical protein
MITHVESGDRDAGGSRYRVSERHRRHVTFAAELPGEDAALGAARRERR